MEHYLWLKAAHLLAVMGWVAGMLSLPWLLARQAAAAAGSDAAAQLGAMARTLLKRVINPAGISVFGTGLWLWLGGPWGESGWAHAKVVLALGLGAVHGILSGHHRALEQGEVRKGPAFYRTMGWVAVALVVALVLTAVLKPF